ncbi:MAG: EF-P lysine aminoacylase EpmA [Syntrophorhabdaceae bacterium]|nr:EF-P lysine aminoacylase EpmA [Syntrophorhabdaceae bacterium]
METMDMPGTHDILTSRHELLRATRDFFYERGYLEVETANLMATAPPDPHIEPLAVHVGTKGPFSLHTSPEMGMKKLLRFGHRRIFQICKVWRVEDHQELHNTEFTMVEWYREGSYRDVMNETEELVESIARRLLSPLPDLFLGPYPVHQLDQVFRETMGFDPFLLDRDDFFDALAKKGFFGIDDGDDWNSLFFKTLIQEIDDVLRSKKPYIVSGWPFSISTMAKRRDDNSALVERFELYIDGLEIANGYTELTDPSRQRERFMDDNARRARLGKQTFPIDEAFLHALAAINTPCAGVSVGLDRLLMALLGKKTIGEVIPDRLIV